LAGILSNRDGKILRITACRKFNKRAWRRKIYLWEKRLVLVFRFKKRREISGGIKLF